MDSIVWNIAAFLSPPQFSGLSLSSSWGENSLLQVLPGRTAGLLLVGMGWLGYSMMATVSLTNIVAPVAAWAWCLFVK
jgi:hypothetical protein